MTPLYSYACLTIGIKATKKDNYVPYSGIPVGLQKLLSGYSRLREDGAQSRTFYPPMVGHRQRRPRPIRVLSDHRNVIGFSHQTKTQALKGLDDLFEGSICRKLDYQMATPASATKASRTRDSLS